MANRILAASAPALVRRAPRLALAPKIAFTCISSRNASTKPSNDEHTLARSTNILDALMGSTMGLNDKSTSTATPSPLRMTPAARQVLLAMDESPIATSMFIPPAQDPLLTYIVAVIQRHGLRARAARTVSRMLLHIHTFTRAPPTPIVREAIMAAAPAVRIVSFKYGTKVMMTPQPLTEKQRVRAGLKAIIAASESRPGKSLEIRLAREMIAVVQGESRSLEEKERLHKVAMVNRGNIRR